MTIVLLFISLITIYLVTTNLNKKSSILENLLISIITCSLLIVLSTETLSIFHLLNYTGITTFWLTIMTVGIFILLKNKKSLKQIIIIDWRTFVENVKKLSFFYKIVSLGILTLLFFVFFQGLIYPPNNWDSMTYHVPRIAHWIQNESVENYSTNIIRQLYQPLFSEYVILHTHLLFNGDLFSNTVQFSFFLFTSLAVVAVLRELNVTKTILFISILLCFTIPQALLEASSTQNDITHSFFTIASVYFAIKSYKTLSIKFFLFFGICIGFALLTKAIAYIYVPVITLIFGFVLLRKILKEKKHNVLKYSLIILPIILINLGHSFRNYQFSHHITGVDAKTTKGIVFEKTSPKRILSCCIKNIVLHSDPYFVGSLGDKIAEKSHLLMHIDVNEPGTNIFDTKFKATSHWKNHEDSQPNFMHFILFILSVFLFLLITLKTKKVDLTILLFLTLITIQFVLFCGYLCWEPWNTRLHLPLFYEMIIFICLVFNHVNKNRIRSFIYIASPLLLFYGFYVMLHNYSRPYLTTKGLTSDIKISDDRFKKYFANNPTLYSDYKTMQKEFIAKRKFKTIGLYADVDGWEYPIIMNRFEDSNLKIQHVNVTNQSKGMENKTQHFNYILSTFKTDKTLYYHKSKYELLTPSNTYLFIYAKQ